VSPEQLVKDICGKTPVRRQNAGRQRSAAAVLEVSDLCMSHIGPVSFDVAPGEILGLAGLRQRLLSSELLLGTFIKTPTTHATEILGGLGFDFVVIDEEHAPFDRVTIDNLLLAARASNVVGIVRVAESSPAKLLAALDDGVTGVLVPHVFTVEKAKEIVAPCRYRRGKRGFSNSPRAGGYGQLSVWDHVDKADASVTVVATTKDPEAIDVIDDIVAVEGLDAVFICRGDLTVAMDASGTADPRVRAATERIVA
jgi:staphyloferrin B biosynthesis citrate synthase